LQAQAIWAQELEAELVKVRGTESSLWLELERQLAEEKRILSAKYDDEINELRRPWRAKSRAVTPESASWRLSRRLTVSVMTRRLAFGVPTTARFSPACWGWRKLFVVYFLSCFSSLALSCRLLTL
jgi:hypothetical protein